MKNTVLLIAFLISLYMSPIHAQQREEVEEKFFVGSTLFVLANLTPANPEYYQLNVGYRITPKDVLSAELITWTYEGPLGRQYGPDFDNPDSNFPGFVRAYGGGLAYKRFLWKRRLYVQIHSTALKQDYMDENGTKIQSGFQLFNVGRVGYQFRFWEDRIFLEPSVAITSWPVNTNLPESFQVFEDQFPKYFLAEPGLHIGFNF
ncbi:MAG: hypothetical protein AAFY71_10380 [Bacteroidota bacterium]